MLRSLNTLWAKCHSAHKVGFQPPKSLQDFHKILTGFPHIFLDWACLCAYTCFTNETVYHTGRLVSRVKHDLEAMLITHNREKLLNAIIYFCENTSACYITKLFKLLYFLDFEHYKETGRSVTGLHYFAWDMGPVPAELREEIDEPEPDFAEKVEIEVLQQKPDRRIFTFRAKAEFDPTHFTKRELRILKDLAYTYSLTNAKDMVEATHIPTLPWNQVYNVEGRKMERIPYEYALSEDEKGVVLHLAEGHQELLKNYNESRHGHS